MTAFGFGQSVCAFAPLFFVTPPKAGVQLWAPAK
jgi:hypothetical protein